MQRLGLLAVGVFLILIALVLAVRTPAIRPVQVAQVTTTSPVPPTTQSRPVSTVTPTATRTLRATSTAAGTPMPTETLLPNAIPGPEISWYQYALYSSDNQWRVGLEMTQPISVTAVSDPQLEFHDDPPLALGAYPSFVSWFPDNSGFVIYDADRGCERCGWDRLISYQINSQGGFLRHFTFAPPAGPNSAFWNDISWSPDGTHLAAIVNNQEIYLLDRRARVMNKIRPHLAKDEIVNQVTWTHSGLVYRIENRSDPSHVSTEIRLAWLTDRTWSDRTLMHSYDSPAILSASPLHPELLIAHGADTGQGYYGEVAIFDMRTGKYTQSICTWISSPPLDSAVSTDNEFVALRCHDKHLAFFDWKTLLLSDNNVQVDAILKWRQDLGAFLVMQIPDWKSDRTWIAAIKPQ